MNDATPVERAPRRKTAARRRAILDAALHCFHRLGYGATTLEDIRARSGASTGSIYHLFAGKDDLAAALYLDGLRDYQQGLVAELARHREAERGIRAVVGYHLDWVAAQPELARYLLSMRQAEFMAAGETAARALRQAFFRDIFAWMSPRMARGELRRLPEAVLTSLIIGPAHEFSRYWIGRRDAAELQRARRLLADAAWQSVRGGDT